MYSIISDFGKILLSNINPNDPNYKRAILSLICEPIFIKATKTQAKKAQDEENEDEESEGDDDTEETKTEETRLVLIFDFDTKNKKVTFEWDEINANNRKEISEKYLWVGNTPDTLNRYLTTNKLERFFSDENPPDKSKNPIEVLRKTIEECDLKKKLSELFSTFYKGFPQKENAIAEKTAFDFEKLDTFNQNVQNTLPLINNYLSTTDKKAKKELFSQIKEQLPIIKEDMLNGMTTVSNQELIGLINSRLEEGGKKEINAILKALLGDKFDKIQLITVKIDGKLISDNQDYVDFLYNEKFPNSTNMKEDFCDICGEKQPSTSLEYFTKTWIKFFNQDKPIFAPNIDMKRYVDNFRVCKECFMKVIVGEAFVKKTLKLRWFDSSLMLIPEIKPNDHLNLSHLKKIVDKSKEFNGGIYKMTKDYRNLENQIEEIITSIGTASLIYHYLFYSTSQGGKPNKIKLLIKDVPPSRLNEIGEALIDINDHKHNIINKNISIHDIYLTLPIRLDKKTKSSKETQLIYSLIECIFKKLPINLEEYLDSCVQTIKTIMIGNPEQMNIKNEKIPYSIMKMNEIISFFEKVGCLNLPQKSRYVIKMEETENQQGNAETKTKMQKILAYWKDKAVYNTEEARSLFLLGTLIAEVGNAQYKKINNEAILKKINYDGMNLNQIIQLVSDVEGKLRDYKKLTYPSTMQIVQQLHSYFEKVDPNSWTLLPSANVFFIMSGYAFLKSMIFQQQPQGSEQDEQSDSEE